MEWKLFGGDVPYVSTYEYHSDRPRAPHLEQSDHRPRLELAARFVQRCYDEAHIDHSDFRVVDLGCGDGGLVQLVKGMRLRELEVIGFDFQPTNEAGWRERGVECKSMNVFPAPPDPSPINQSLLYEIQQADVVVMTEVLEHIARPHAVLETLSAAPGSRYLVASSPWNENDRTYADCHAWAWDEEGYRHMIESAGFDILDTAKAGLSQVVRAITRR